ncbi:unnamed protein product, partial [Meganyctiphanes norvegica]
CGRQYPLKGSGRPAMCNPWSRKPCCSEEGFCGGTDSHCRCRGCIDYRKSYRDDAEHPDSVSEEDNFVAKGFGGTGLCEYKRCGTNAECKSNTGRCECLPGYRGNPIFKCTERGKCDGVRCGRDAFCNHKTGCCECSAGKYGDPNSGCESRALCDGVLCVNNAECSDSTGNCHCKQGYTGDVESECLQMKRLAVVYLSFTLRQPCVEEHKLKKFLINEFCIDLMTIRENKCHPDVVTKVSPFYQYLKCPRDLEPLAGTCYVNWLKAGGEAETTDVSMGIIFENDTVSKTPTEFVYYQLRNLPGLMMPAINSLYYFGYVEPSNEIEPMVFDLASYYVGDDLYKRSLRIQNPGHCDNSFASMTTCNNIIKVEQELSQHETCMTRSTKSLCTDNCNLCTGTGMAEEDIYECVDLFGDDCDKISCEHHEYEAINFCAKKCRKCANFETRGCKDLIPDCAVIRHKFGCLSSVSITMNYHLLCRKTCSLCDFGGTRMEIPEYLKQIYANTFVYV